MMKLPLTTITVLILSAAHSLVTADELLKSMPVMFKSAGAQTRLLLESAKDSDGFPRTFTDEGKLVTVKATDWTSGFFPGTLWLLHEADPDGGWKDKAWEISGHPLARPAEYGSGGSRRVMRDAAGSN